MRVAEWSVGALVLAAAIMLVGVPQKGGTWLIVLVPVVLGCSVYALVRMAWRPAERSMRVKQIAAWLASVAVVGAAQAYWSATARKAADAVVGAVQAHRQRTGSFPPNLAQVGLNDGELLASWRLSYRLRDGEAELTYPAQVMPISTHEYDFKAGRWRLNAY